MGPVLPKSIEKTKETCQIQVLLNCPPVGPPQPPWSSPTGPPGVWNIKKCQILLSWVHRNTNPPEKLMKNSYFYNLQNWPPWPPKPPTPWPPWGSQISSMTKTHLIGSPLVQPNQKIGKKALNGPNPTWPPFWTHSALCIINCISISIFNKESFQDSCFL